MTLAFHSGCSFPDPNDVGCRVPTPSTASVLVVSVELWTQNHFPFPRSLSDRCHWVSYGPKSWYSKVNRTASSV